MEALDCLEALFPGERLCSDVLAVEVAAFLMLGRMAEARVIAEMAIDAFYGEACVTHAMCATMTGADEETALECARHVIFSRDLINGVLAMVVEAQHQNEETGLGLAS